MLGGLAKYALTHYSGRINMQAMVARTPGAGFYADAYRRLVERHAPDLPIAIVDAEISGARGRSVLKSVTLHGASGAERHACRWLFVDAPLSPAYELARMAGAKTRLGEHGYELVHDEGRLGAGLWCFGEVAGLAPSPDRLSEAAEKLARAMAPPSRPSTDQRAPPRQR